MCTTDSAGSSTFLKKLQSLDIVRHNHSDHKDKESPQNMDDYSSSDEEDNINDSVYPEHFEKHNYSSVYKNNSTAQLAADLHDPLNSRLAENICIHNSKNVDIGHKFYLNENNIKQVENVLEVLIAKRSREKSKTINVEFPILPRVRWMAQPALEEKLYLEEPAKYVIITHTATEEGFKESENVLLIRTTQTFHIESQHWADIAYNFLVGSDSNIYEGRGWNVQGSHTLGYNSTSLGIAFVGCFLKHLPPKSALKKCQRLISYGVESGYIKEDYQLLAHRQCRPFESPGRSLFEEIKTWKNWNPNISTNDPPPFSL